jgi:DNA-binding MurR/RpiR family transcriptional regulator
VAADAQHKFFRSGVPTVAYSDPHIHSIAAALLRAAATAWWRSRSAATARLVRSMKLARRGGADVIVLAPSGTPLAELATVLIPIDLIFNIDPYTPISARLAHLVVIDVLAWAWPCSAARSSARRCRTRRRRCRIRHAIRFVYRLTAPADRRSDQHSVGCRRCPATIPRLQPQPRLKPTRPYG